MILVTCPIDTSLETRLHIGRRNGAKVLSVAEFDDKIYVLLESSDFYSVRVYENKKFDNEIPLECAFEPKAIIASQKLRYLFVHCKNESLRVQSKERWRFWRLSLPHGSEGSEGSEFENWFGETEQLHLQGNTRLNLVSFSVSEYGHLTLLKYDEQISSHGCQLDSYQCQLSLEPPELLSSIHLKIKDPHHAVETSNMTFIISHGFLGESGILEISSDGDIIRRFAYLDAKNQSPIIAEPVYLTLASHDRLIVASKRNDSIIVVDAQLNLHETILTSQNHGIRGPTQICYFGKELLVLHNKYKNIDIFSLKNTTL